MPCTVTFFLTVLRLIPRSLGRVSTAIPNSPPAQDVLGPQNQRKSPNEVSPELRWRVVPAPWRKKPWRQSEWIALA